MIFNKSGERREVTLTPGVNIITGESKTGKSALVEIIDYCLCSSRCTVPKGKITDFAYLYVLPMVIDENTYVIARYNWDNKGKMHIAKESKDYDLNNITLNYFSDKSELSAKDVQYNIEEILGLHVSNLELESEKRKKASLRNMVSYLFQHQNLMASKFALFYRFSDFYKRKDVIEQFPIFAGMVSQKYYSRLIELNSLKKKLKNERKIQGANRKSSDYVRKNLVPLLEDYYAFFDKEIDKNLKIGDMIRLARELPDFDDSQLFNENGIAQRYHSLKRDLEILRNHDRDYLLKIENLKRTNMEGNNFSELLVELKHQTEVNDTFSNNYVCPFCGNECKALHDDDINLVEATKWLEDELKITQKYSSDFSEEIRKLNEAHLEIEDKTKKVYNQIKYLEKKYMKSKDLVSRREKVYHAKSRIELYSELISSDIFENVDEKIESIEISIQQIEGEIDGFDLDKKKYKAQRYIDKNMNQLALTLDFEEEYKPIDLKFDIVGETFDLYQFQEKSEKIFLYEMGSGANWVSCHIALFLSFLRFFSSQKFSPIPSVMFFDQPSQVYFPQDSLINKVNLSQSDLNAVNKMYKTIFDEIKSIEKEVGFAPQILIVDHVDGKGLEVEKEFKSYVRADWRNGKALI